MASNKYYAVKKGHKTGIFNSWDECKNAVEGYSGATYKGFKTMKEAKEFMTGSNNNNTPIKNEKAIAPSDSNSVDIYVDGSYDDNKKVYSCGVVILLSPILEFKKADNNPNYVAMRNVSGELMGAFYAIKWAIQNIDKYKTIVIHYDYEGIEKWAKGEWKAKNDLTKMYVDYYNKASSSVNIQFVKILAHSGNLYNDMVDKLAKEAIILFDEKLANTNPNKNTEEPPTSQSYVKCKIKKDSILTVTNIVFSNSVIDSEKIYVKFKEIWKSKKLKLNDILDLCIVVDVIKAQIIYSVVTTANENIELVFDIANLDNGGII